MRLTLSRSLSPAKDQILLPRLFKKSGRDGARVVTEDDHGRAQPPPHRPGYRRSPALRSRSIAVRHLHFDDHGPADSQVIFRSTMLCTFMVHQGTKPLSDSGMRQSAITWTSAQRRARASLAISGPGRAYSVARAGTGRTERSSASATAERRRRDRAPRSEVQAALSIHMKLTMRSFRAPFRVRLSHHPRCSGRKPSSTWALSGTRSTEHAPRSDAGPGKKFRNPTTRDMPALS